MIPGAARILLLLLVLLSLPGAVAHAAKQTVAVFPLRVQGEGIPTGRTVLLEQALAEKLKDRLDIRSAGEEAPADAQEVRRRARVLGASYTLTGTIARIGTVLTLDLTLAPAEGESPGWTVVATAEERMDAPAAEGVPGEGAAGSPDLPFPYRRLVLESTSKLKLRFFGDGTAGEAGNRRTYPRLTGAVVRSLSLPGQPVSAAKGDTDLDGAAELVVAFPDSIGVYRIEGNDPVEKARIREAGPGLVHVEVADVTRNGVADLVATRYVSGRASSDVWEHDGKEFRKVASDLPLFLRVADLGAEGIVLLGQESDPVTIFRGPVFRVALNRYGMGEKRERESPLPLPEGTWIYSFSPLRRDGAVRFVTFGEGKRVVLRDASGGKVWESPETILFPEIFVEAPGIPETPTGGGSPGRRMRKPPRILPVDLDGDRSDEFLLVNALTEAGGFFENVRQVTGMEVVCYAQAQDRMELVWRTGQTDGEPLDAIALPDPRKGLPELSLVSRDRGKILGAFGEWYLLWLR